MKQTTRRLLPLYFSTFFERSMFWYALEKVFMRELGFDDASTGFALSIMYILSLLFEIPSGIMADAWSRKGTTYVSLTALLIATIGCGLSTSVPQYIFLISFWGVYQALKSGTKQALIYDMSLEVEGQDTNFKRYFGTHNIIEGIALVLGSLGASGIVIELPISMTFYLSVPLILLSMAALLFLQEPTLHRRTTNSKILDQTKQTFQEATRQPHLYFLIAVLVCSYAIIRLIYAYAQLWWLPLGLSISLFGFSNAILDCSVWISGYFAPRINNSRLIFLSFFAVAASLLLTTRNLYSVTVAMVVLLSITYTYSVAFTEKLNQNLSSEVRAGAISVVGLVSNISAIIIVFIFGHISKATSIFNASWIATLTSVLLAFCVHKSIKNSSQLNSV